MAAYASRRHPFERQPAPHAMLVILVGHIAVIAAVMSARMDLPTKVVRSITETYNVPLPKEPPPPEPQPKAEPQPRDSVIERPAVIVPVPRPNPDRVDARPVPLPMPGEPIGPRVDPLPQPRVDPKPQPPVRTGPRFATPPSALRPPYPASKIASEEEAVLKLRLSIDERGRVIAVHPVGRADPAFLQAARGHLLAKWRYQPATEDGRPVASSTVITLRFQLDG